MRASCDYMPASGRVLFLRPARLLHSVDTPARRGPMACILATAVAFPPNLLATRTYTPLDAGAVFPSRPAGQFPAVSSSAPAVCMSHALQIRVYIFPHVTRTHRFSLSISGRVACDGLPQQHHADACVKKYLLAACPAARDCSFLQLPRASPPTFLCFHLPCFTHTAWTVTTCRTAALTTLRARCASSRRASRKF